MVLLATPVASFVIVTVAPWMDAFVGSWTVPCSRAPVEVTWPIANGPDSEIAISAVKTAANNDGLSEELAICGFSFSPTG